MDALQETNSSNVFIRPQLHLSCLLCPQTSTIAALSATGAVRDAEINVLKETLATASTEAEHHSWDSEQMIMQLQGENQVCTCMQVRFWWILHAQYWTAFLHLLTNGVVMWSVTVETQSRWLRSWRDRTRCASRGASPDGNPKP